MWAPWMFVEHARLCIKASGYGRGGILADEGRGGWGNWRKVGGLLLDSGSKRGERESARYRTSARSELCWGGERGGGSRHPATRSQLVVKNGDEKAPLLGTQGCSTATSRNMPATSHGRPHLDTHWNTALFAPHHQECTATAALVARLSARLLRAPARRARAISAIAVQLGPKRLFCLQCCAYTPAAPSESPRCLLVT